MSKSMHGIGVIGCGGFALFASDAFVRIPEVRIVAAADTSEPAAKSLAQRFDGARILPVEELVRQPDVDLVYIATPPHLHHTQALLALHAGKHVICEKPLALNLDQADEMIGAARERGLVLVANLMQRYNPLSDAVKTIIDSKVLGDVLHGYFENYASDERLESDHWFWDSKQSGGIFIEHAVHFFDLFDKWLGRGVVEAGQASVRPGASLEDQVQCTVRYRGDVLVNSYHGFTQVNRMDRQELRLLFERGDVTLHEWVPTRAHLRAVVNEAALRQLLDLFPGAELRTIAHYSLDKRACRGRHKDYEVDYKIELNSGRDVDKGERYGAMVRAMLEDQLAWIRDPSHIRRLTEQNGRDSLAMANEATRLAHAS